MKTNVRITSLDAYFFIRGGTTLNQKGLIIEDLTAAQKSLTRSELSKRTGIRINAIAGRVNELIRDGYLRETIKRKCTDTNMDVHPVGLTDKVYG